eukprot:gb/GECG01014703.1/.p1 GENE.gb/GECG01014703.1/~~gb/GECG01014703.1/.p1  ORF type:complete len:616 (+),score=84.64 gb/GECG01014703.1/:1-1848(+)
MVRLLTGDETGLYKDVSLEKEHAIRWGIQSRRNGIIHMRWSGQVDAPVHRGEHPEGDDSKNRKREYKAREAYLTSINRSGVVQTWESSTQNLAHEFQAIESPFGNANRGKTHENGKQINDDNSRNDLSKLTPAAVRPLPSQTCVGLEVLPSGASGTQTQFPRGHPTKFLVGTHDGAVRLFDLGSQSGTSPIFCLSTGSNMEVVRSHSPGGVIATAGKENLLRLWDMETQKQFFDSKNVRHNNLNMRVPYWDTDAQFWEAGNDGSNLQNFPRESEGRLVVTCGKHGYVRLYDSRERKRPVYSFGHGEWPFNRLICAHDKNYVYVCDTTGELHRFDLRNQKLLCSYKGHAGSIRDLALHPRLPLVASVGLGRSLFVHHTETRTLVKRVYMKQKITSVLFTSEMKRKHTEQGIPSSSNSTAVNVAKRLRKEGNADNGNPDNGNLDARRSQRWAPGESPAAFSSSQYACASPQSKFLHDHEDSDNSSSDEDSSLWKTLDENAQYNRNVNQGGSEEFSEDANSLLSDDDVQDSREQDDVESSSSEEDGAQGRSTRQWAEEWAEESDNESLPSDDEEAVTLVDSKKAQHKMKKETAEARRTQARTRKRQGNSTANVKRRKQ